MDLQAGLRQRNIWKAEARNKLGELLWTEEFENEIMDEGLDEALNTALRNQTPTAAWYIGLTTAIPTQAPGDVMNSHGWTECVAYSQGTRQAVTFAAPSNPAGTGRQSVGSTVTFTINAANTNIGGAFVTSGSAKSGTTGKLFACGDFATLRTLGDGDTLNVTLTVLFDSGI